MEKYKDIIVFGSACNPPHFGHIEVVKQLLTINNNALVLLVVSGVRPDKPNLIHADHRVAMTFLAYSQLISEFAPRLRVRVDDAYNSNTPTIKKIRVLEQEFPDSNVSWCIGTDVIVPRREYNGQNEIEACWVNGSELLKRTNLLVVPRKNISCNETIKIRDNITVLDVNVPGISSSQVRRYISANSTDIEQLVPSPVLNYIVAFDLYLSPKSK